MLPLPSAVAIMLMPDHSMLAAQSPELGCVTVTVIRPGEGATVCAVPLSKSSGPFSTGVAELGDDEADWSGAAKSASFAGSSGLQLPLLMTVAVTYRLVSNSKPAGVRRVMPPAPMSPGNASAT